MKAKIFLLFAGFLLLVEITCSYGDDRKGYESVPSEDLLEAILSGKCVGIVNGDRVNIHLSSIWAPVG